MAGSTSSRSSGVSCAEMTGLPHWEKARPVSFRQRGKSYTLPLAPAAPPQDTTWQALSLQAAPNTGTISLPPFHGVGQFVPGYEAALSKVQG